MDFLLWGRFLIAMVSSILLLGGIFVSFCSLGFWLNDRLEIKAPLMQLMQMARYPTSIYSNSVVFIITWILPLAFVGFLPSLYILLDQRLRGLYQLLPMVSVVWFILSITIWKTGIKKYTSVS
jgi:ABC-2 type transport system permease protein